MNEISKVINKFIRDLEEASFKIHHEHDEFYEPNYRHQIRYDVATRNSFEKWKEENSHLITGFRSLFEEKIKALEAAYINFEFERYLLKQFEKDLEEVQKQSDMAQVMINRAKAKEERMKAEIVNLKAQTGSK